MSDPNLRRDDNSSPSATGKRNEAPQSAAPNMGARSASPGAMERRPPDLEAARNFRQLSQAERLRDDGMKAGAKMRSEEHTSELQSLMRTSYAVFFLKKNKQLKPI